MFKNIFSAVLVILLGVVPAVADQRSTGFHGIGPRVGLTFNPDQVHFGGHIDFGDISPGMMMLTNLEIGFGNDLTTVAPSFELDYRFHDTWGVWTPYLGGGVGPILYSHDNGGSSSDFAAYLQFGVGKGSAGNQSGHFFIEGKFGLSDASDFKTTAGWTFGK